MSVDAMKRLGAVVLTEDVVPVEAGIRDFSSFSAQQIKGLSQLEIELVSDSLYTYPAPLKGLDLIRSARVIERVVRSSSLAKKLFNQLDAFGLSYSMHAFPQTLDSYEPFGFPPELSYEMRKRACYVRTDFFLSKEESRLKEAKRLQGMAMDAVRALGEDLEMTNESIRICSELISASGKLHGYPTCDILSYRRRKEEKCRAYLDQTYEPDKILSPESRFFFQLLEEGVYDELLPNLFEGERFCPERFKRFVTNGIPSEVYSSFVWGFIPCKPSCKHAMRKGMRMEIRLEEVSERLVPIYRAIRLYVLMGDLRIEHRISRLVSKRLLESFPGGREFLGLSEKYRLETIPYSLDWLDGICLSFLDKD
jgi:hypothetical protein